METTHTGFEAHVEASERTAKGTMYLQGLTGVAAVALAIIGLAHVFPEVLLAVATIVLGASLLFESGAVAARFSALFSAEENTNVAVSQWGGGVTTGFMAGFAGIALGILALLHVVPMVLVPIAVIAYGCALVFDSGIYNRLNNLEASMSRNAISRELAYESGATASGMQMLVGLGAITLGILALVGINALVLTLVAILGIGSSLVLSETLLGSRVREAFTFRRNE